MSANNNLSILFKTLQKYYEVGLEELQHPDIVRTSFCFSAESLGLPYLSAYLNSVGTNFSHGANFNPLKSSYR